ncbi:uncharacterized protein LOC142223173 isoform X2 [Haematobia irritans]|uniref:uncharacterized protein LOC142223173 isoform X2 n=1 Tax=Haematobia irritans TaxID=7368 RepID=UPI003F502BD0
MEPLPLDNKIQVSEDKFSVNETNDPSIEVCNGSDSEDSSSKQIIRADGEVRIQLEGTHTTSSGTESDICNVSQCSKIHTGKTLVRQDSGIFPKELFDANISCKSQISPNKQMSVGDTTGKIANKINEDKQREDLEAQSSSNTLREEKLDDLDPNTSTARSCKQWNVDDIARKKEYLSNLVREKLQKPMMAEQNKELTERFKELMQKFDELTKNLESLGGTTTSVPISLPTIWESEENLAVVNGVCESRPAIQESDSICQSSLVTLSHHTSNSDLNQSMNNYANSEHALEKHDTPEGHPLIIRKSSPEPTVITEAPRRQDFHVIHINTRSSPDPSVMQRPPLCQRIWDVITDFCAAICLCLQVNRDCIFCLCFFVAFVVSASFLTAFFYRTLSLSPTFLRPPTLGLLEHKGQFRS